VRVAFLQNDAGPCSGATHLLLTINSTTIFLTSPAGARFALSPIEPQGFIDACHNNGILAVPAGEAPLDLSRAETSARVYSPLLHAVCLGSSVNELWDMHRRGARVIKLFHAGTIGPKILK
jgi:2-keto-3-deoxy-6-phosphogluconate aldolase